MSSRPQVFITIVLLLSWTDFYKGRNHVDTIDCFAGAARVAKVARAYSYTAIALDVGYHPNTKVFDLNASAGFAFLCFKITWSFGLELQEKNLKEQQSIIYIYCIRFLTFR